MGTWGVGVWQDDVAWDVILVFEDLLNAGVSPSDAVRRVLVDPPWPWEDRDDEVVQLLALAALALREGVLGSALRDRAIAIIVSGDALNRWTESGPDAVAARQEVLDTFTVLLVAGAATVDALASITES